MAQLDIDKLCKVTQHPQQLSSDLIAPSTTNTVRPSATANGKPGRKSRFTQADDIINAREVAATHVYLAAYGEVRECYQHAADHANRNTSLSVKLNGKSIQNRYKNIQ